MRASRDDGRRPRCRRPSVEACYGSSARSWSSEVSLKLRVIYRSTGPGNRKGRPPFFDKLLSLVSLLHSAAACEVRPDLVFVNDGAIPDARLALMRAEGRVVELPGLGNSGSYRRVLAEAVTPGWQSDDLAYLVEDDYLHRVEALPVLTAAAPLLTPCAYFTLYDHPDHYAAPTDLRSGDVSMAGGWHWRNVESTCMTFAARPSALTADRWLHWLGTVPHTPRDHMIWRASQRLGPFRLLPRLHRRRLVTATPALATHLENGMLAPGVDWDAVADHARAWGRERGWPTEEATPTSN